MKVGGGNEGGRVGMKVSGGNEGGRVGMKVGGVCGVWCVCVCDCWCNWAMVCRVPHSKED